MHAARIEAAERTGVVVDLRDAEVARLELLDEALNPLFAEIPSEVDLFDLASAVATPRGCGSTQSRTSPWGATSGCIVSCTIPASAGASWPSRMIPDLVKAVTDYVARRLI